MPDRVNAGASTVTEKGCVAVSPCGSRAVTWISARPRFSAAMIAVLSSTVTVATCVLPEVASYASGSSSGSLKYCANSR